MKPRRIVLATAGSLGDLHPFLALGVELRRRGHQVVVATNHAHRTPVENAGLAFHHMRPDPEHTPEFHARFMDPKRGGEFAFRDYLAPAIRTSYADLLEATRNADLLVSQSLMALAAPLVAAKTGIRWASAVLQPMSFFSLHERPNYLPIAPLAWACGRYPELHAQVFHYVRKHTESWVAPVLAYRRELGIKGDAHPMYEGQHAPRRVLAMFSPLIGPRRADWPAAAVQTGAALFRDARAELTPELRAFLARDDAPLAVFTLSSAASNAAGSFYRESLDAARALGLRALLIMGGLASKAALPEPLPASAMRIAYAPFELVFPHADVIVHSGGVATCAKALEAGRPQIVVPHAHDQLDNALRLSQAGVARLLRPRRARGGALRRALRESLADAGLRERAAKLALQAQTEDGVSRACDALEEMFADA
ncbi:glycosyltransferase [Noviherbaspirillum pedocola]|uniref:Glycosyltransferase family 1 protein n=1 Tax=Noviherbaspirillum pedocola TaxID=2801341 RepID=A0A934SYU9_9BURK|nr:glycosyltransferase [Noviherbaspirillum pedocola]MBK4735452.1 glycosyltransferase family 1 protein [Noviherbaspirillum pedocola]